MSEEKQSTSPEQEATATTTNEATVVAGEDKAASELTVTADSAGAIATDEATANSDETASQKIFKDLVNNLKELWQKVSSNEQKPKVTIAAIAVLVILGLILASRLLEIIDNAPLLEPFFELVGISYSIWFVRRYLLFADTRQELVNNVQGIKSKIFG